MAIYYSENPNLGLKVVDTVTGKKEYRNNCKAIGKPTPKYYIINEDCFLVGGTWYRLDSGKITFDHEKKEYSLKTNPSLIEGVVSVSGDNVTTGSFTPNKYKNCTVVDKHGRTSHCISSEILNDSFIERNGSGHYVHKNNLSKGDIQNYGLIRNGDNYQSNKYTYNIDDDQYQFQNLIKVYEDSKFPVSKDLVRYQKYLNNITYGIELEAIRGTLPQNLRYKYGIQLCRDGSLHDENGEQGPEYVTVPMSGARGLQNIKNFCGDLQKRNVFDYNCALHIHIGNIRKDRTFIVALYKLASMIQNSLFSMFPMYKLDEVKYAKKQKNYCKKIKLFLPNYEGRTKEEYDSYIDSAYKTIFTFLLDGSAVPSFMINRTNNVHPKANKWERVARYYWINFMNMFFSKRDTIEFRLHTPTFNSEKIINWLFICNAILLYAENNVEKIIKNEVKINIKDILKVYSEVFNEKSAVDLSDHLNKYYMERSAYFKELGKKGEYVPMEEIEKDSTYTFTNSNLKNIF